MKELSNLERRHTCRVKNNIHHIEIAPVLRSASVLLTDPVNPGVVVCRLDSLSSG